ncbi:MAG: hypothetical protein ACR2P8_08600 [Myxococcota bacterium]
MKYLDFDALEAIDPDAYQAVRPYPWLNPEELLTHEGFRLLLETFPDISLFEKVYGVKRAHGQMPHDRYNLEYRPGLALSEPWRDFIGELTDGRYQRLMRRLLNVPDLKLRLHWHYQPAGCSVSPHCDNLDKLGSHLFYFNPEDEWDESWGGNTLILDDGGRYARSEAPGFDAFEGTWEASCTGNRSLLFTQGPKSWHGLREIRCPEGYARRVFIVVVCRVKRLERWKRLLLRKAA